MSEDPDMQPSEIARETLRQLAMRRIPPTPDNYLTLYNEISGVKTPEAFPSNALKQLAAAMPASTTEQVRYGRLLDAAISSGNWDGLRDALAEIFERGGSDPLPWGPMLKDLLSQLEVRSASLTQAKKRESLDHVLRASGSPETLFQRLQNIVRHWSRNTTPEEGVQATLPEEAAAAEEPKPTVILAKPITGELRDLLARVLEEPMHALLHDAPELAEQSVQLARTVRAATQEKQINDMLSQLKQFSYRVSYAAEDQAELKSELLGILKLLIQNIGEIVIDEEWLHGQITTVSDMLAKPLDLRTLDTVERQLKDVIYKQSALKRNLLEANDRLKQMLATFVDRLGDFSSTTGDYHDKIEACATRISQARDISEVSAVLEEVMRETRNMQINTARSHDDVGSMRRRVQEAEHEVERLMSELSQASEMVRVDPLTGALNRKGMEEAMQREVARTRRHDAPLSIALLDIDNFKQINDTLGHRAGDLALQHLANVTREAIRPQDTLVRFGGEEFVILLPDTGMEDAVKAMERVQRELTRRYFMSDNNKLLITFSAGVSVMANGEEASETIRRADQAMYLAKRAGKNRVMAS
ncbi:MAG TPA: GGDEF domain-containing protein [Rhodocyclaceae bacterium]|nr:GGDEF domain-containing protein [Rhodocyclaceae bacterium]